MFSLFNGNKKNTEKSSLLVSPINEQLINVTIDTNTLTQFKRDMLKKLQKRSRDPLDKLVAGIGALDTRLKTSLIVADVVLLLLAAGSMGYYSIEFIKEQYPMSTFTTNITDWETPINTSTTTFTQDYLDYVDPAMLPLIGTTLLTAALLIFTLTVLLGHLTKYNSLKARYNSRDNTAIKALEDSIHTKIINTTDEEAKSEGYRQWMKHYIWNEKVNQPVAPFVVNNAEPQQALGL